MSLDCQISIPEVPGLEAGKLTVGRHLNLTCSGELPAGVVAEKLQLKPAENNPYGVKLLALKAGAQGLSLDLTYYTAGEHSLSELVLFDGQTEIPLTGPKVKFESVLQPTPDGKPQEPFGSVAPVGIHTPAYYYFIAAGILLFFVLLAVLRFRRLAYFRQLKLKLKQYQSPLAPDTQFYKSVRQAEKLGYPADIVEKAFRLYVLRAFDLPVFDLPDERLLRYFKRNYPGYKNARHSLQKLLGDFEEIRKRGPSAVTPEEKNDFIKKLYRFVDAHKGLKP